MAGLVKTNWINQALTEPIASQSNETTQIGLDFRSSVRPDQSGPSPKTMTFANNDTITNFSSPTKPNPTFLLPKTGLSNKFYNLNV